ncbi:MAG TPA: flagellin [Blastocatellia bacterium]|nr:flagellin [Blastocatellia bacterium]
MPFRITDSSSAARTAAQISAARQRGLTAQEQISTGKRINRPSDDPAGAEVVIRIRTAQTAAAQLAGNADTALNTLQITDGSLESYETLLDRARALLTNGASDSTDAATRRTTAIEIDSIRTSALALANQRYGDQYIFGGTRQDVPPYDSNGVAAATPTTQQSLQIDAGGETLAFGVTAENVFRDANGDIFQALSDAATALRGTGNAAADRTTILNGITRLGELADQSRVARTQIGSGIDRLQNASDTLKQRSLSFEESAQRVEGSDFVEAAINLTESQRVLEAILQTQAASNRRSLIDLLG